MHYNKSMNEIKSLKNVKDLSDLLAYARNIATRYAQRYGVAVYSYYVYQKYVMRYT